MRLPPLAFGGLDPRPGAEVDLGLLARLALHPPHGQRTNGAQAFEQSPHAVVTDPASSEFGHQVLVNPFGGEPLRVPSENGLSPRLGIALPSGGADPDRRGGG